MSDTTLAIASQQELLAALAAPFDTALIGWLVTQTQKDNKARGAVVPYADARAYADRLNRVLTTSGWSNAFTVSAIPVTVERGGKLVQTSKIVATCTVTITGLGTHASTGEQWAEDENAMTAAEAQAFKRACSFFGLGRYLYDFAPQWVDLDPKTKKPVKPPVVPAWAQPAVQAAPAAAKATMAPPVAQAIAPAVKAAPDQALDDAMVVIIEGFSKELGPALYADVFAQSHFEPDARALPSITAQRLVLDKFLAVRDCFVKLRQLADRFGEGPFMAVMDHHKLSSVWEITSLALLRNVYRELNNSTSQLSRRAA